jgi:hypothetical protein
MSNTITVSSPIFSGKQSIMDQHGQTHCIELSNETVLLDGSPSMINIVGAYLHLVTKAGTFSVTAQAFWYAFAGTEPTATEASCLLVDSLMRVKVFQQVQHLQKQFQQVYEQSQARGTLQLPTCRQNQRLLLELRN